MRINGTIINYYFHCKRQCYLFSNRINLEDNSEDVRTGKILHEIRAKTEQNTEIQYDNMVLDKITKEYVEEFKKSDTDIQAAKMQLLFYLKNLKDKGIKKEGKLVFYEKNKKGRVQKVILNEETKKELTKCVKQVEELIQSKQVPEVIQKPICKRCAYYDYCYI